jgi:hypothetical protein
MLKQKEVRESGDMNNCWGGMEQPLHSTNWNVSMNGDNPISPYETEEDSDDNTGRRGTELFMATVHFVIAESA